MSRPLYDACDNLHEPSKQVYNLSMCSIKKDRKMHELTEQDQQDWQLYVEQVFNSPDEFIPKMEQIALPKRMDLHGMTVGEAHGRTQEFIEDHYEAGTQSVVIITGKSGQIAHEFTEWCRQMPKVRKYDPIADSRGGIGSYRIWFRR
jgi:dsDNA-specific endonuclease/ATPase MutS2